MTMDGRIVADFITTGILNAALLKAGAIKGQKGNMTIDLDNDVMDIKNGAISITRPDGYKVINNGMATFDFSVDEASPPQLGTGVYTDGNWWYTQEQQTRDVQFFSFRHQARYLKFSLAAGAEPGGGGKIFITDIQRKAIAEKKITQTLDGDEAKIGFQITIDLGVPDGSLKSVYLRAISSLEGTTGGKKLYIRKIRAWLEG